MSVWIYILAAVIAAWSLLRLFTAERDVRVAQLEVDHLRELAAAKRAKRRAELGHRN